jgi:hypothetical protein
MEPVACIPDGVADDQGAALRTATERAGTPIPGCAPGRWAP